MEPEVAIATVAGIIVAGAAKSRSDGAMRERLPSIRRRAGLRHERLRAVLVGLCIFALLAGRPIAQAQAAAAPPWLDPQSFRPLMRVGGNDSGPLATAYRQAIRLDPGNAVLHYQLGVILQSQLVFDDDAIAEYREAIRLDSKFAEPHAKLGDIWMRQAKSEEAIAEYSEAIRLTSALHAKLGLAWGQLFKIDEAIAEYREGVRLNPNEASLHANLGRLLMARGVQKIDEPEGIALLREACTEFMTAAKLAPSDTVAPIAMGAANHWLGDRGHCPP
jgi:tetratricopeptide (TPR) repeat protein